MSLVGALGVLVWRLRETARPLSPRAILIPPLAMSTGTAVFLFAPFQIPPAWAFWSVVVGAVLFSYPLIKTTQLYRQGEQVFMRRSKAFLWVLLTLLVVRIALRGYAEQYISVPQTGGLFFLLAWGMIWRWRMDLWFRYKALLGS